MSDNSVELKKIPSVIKHNVKLMKDKYGTSVLSLSGDRMLLRMFLREDAILKVYPDSKSKQFVLHLIEPIRTYTEVINAKYLNKMNPKVLYRDFSLRRMNRNRGSILSVEYEEYKEKDILNNVFLYKLTGKVRMPASKNYFLIGYDEDHLFISQLRKPVTSVQEAHKELRPDVSKNAIRIGEYFHEEVKDKKLINRLNQVDRQLSYNRFQHGDMLYAFGAVYKNKVYVLGQSKHDRNRHKPKMFHTWHKVVTNKEVVNTSKNYD